MTDENSPREDDLTWLYDHVVSPSLDDEERFCERVSFLIQDGNVSDKDARLQAFGEVFGGW